MKYGHAGPVEPEQLKTYIERIERLEKDQSEIDIQETMIEVYSKALGMVNDNG